MHANGLSLICSGTVNLPMPEKRQRRLGPACRPRSEQAWPTSARPIGVEPSASVEHHATDRSKRGRRGELGLHPGPRPIAARSDASLTEAYYDRVRDCYAHVGCVKRGRRMETAADQANA